MADHDDSAVCKLVPNDFLHLPVGIVVHTGAELVEEQQSAPLLGLRGQVVVVISVWYASCSGAYSVPVSQHRTSKAKQLLLPLGQHIGLQSGFEATMRLNQPIQSNGSQDGPAGLGRRYAKRVQVLLKRRAVGEEHHILGDREDPFAEACTVDARQGLIVDGYTIRTAWDWHRIQEPKEQQYDGRLATSTAAAYRNLLSGTDGKLQVL